MDTTRKVIKMPLSKTYTLLTNILRGSYLPSL